jgi:hypothetical protein
MRNGFTTEDTEYTEECVLDVFLCALCGEKFFGVVLEGGEHV